MSSEKFDLEAKPAALKGAEDEDLSSQDVLRTAPRPYRVTVEVPFVCIYFCSAITGTVMSNLLIERTCTHALGYSAEECARLQVSGDRPPEVQALEEEVQRYTTVVSMVKTIMDGMVPAAMAMFLGVWSNTHGRKPLVIWPTFGYALATILSTSYSYFGSLGPWWYVVMSLPYALAGGACALNTGVVCILVDLSSEESRTMRAALIQAALFTGMITGSLSATYTYAAVGTSNLLIIASCIATAGFLFTLFCVPETLPNPTGGGFKTIFDFSKVKEMFRTCFKLRPNHGRAVLFLLIASNSIDIFSNYGTGNIDYLYVRQKLGWNIHEQSIFGAVNTVVMIFGLFFGVIILQRLFKISDGLMTIISYVSCVTEALVRGFATSTWMMYFGSAISIFRGLSFALIRSIISKRVQPGDVAKIFAFISALDAVLPLVAPLLYNLLYRQTLSTVLGAVYFMTSGFYVVCVVLMCAAYYIMRRYPIDQNSKS